VRSELGICQSTLSPSKGGICGAWRLASAKAVLAAIALAALLSAPRSRERRGNLQGSLFCLPRREGSG